MSNYILIKTMDINSKQIIFFLLITYSSIKSQCLYFQFYDSIKAQCTSKCVLYKNKIRMLIN